MTWLRHITLAFLTAASLLATPVTATSFSTDQSDLWYIVAESGWGMQLVQRGNVIFATTGPWFGTVPFNPSNVVATKVGTMTWTAQGDDTGNVSYSVNGTQVSKNVVRQTLVFDDYSGAYLATLHAGITGCTNPADNLAPSDVPSLFNVNVAQIGQSVTITLSAFGL